VCSRASLVVLWEPLSHAAASLKTTRSASRFTSVTHSRWPFTTHAHALVSTHDTAPHQRATGAAPCATDNRLELAGGLRRAVGVGHVETMH